ncbi:MAG TPA: hypothetical protein H9881_05380 [Candidatus Stackebrandtia excrementipullorum]|nr:hypothetical protein [Candidatus Stackebrandtia excrementipullorum]
MLLRLLGTVDVADGEGWQRAGPAKQACVLAALTLAEAPLHTTELIARMWDDDPPVSAPNVLYSHMTRLRSMINRVDGLELTRDRNQGYRLSVAAGQVDVFRMRSMVERAQQATTDKEHARAADLWEQAARLWRGPALSGIDGSWAASVRKNLYKEQLTVLTGRYGTALIRGEHDRIVGELTRMTQAHPTAEALTGQLMLALYRCGRPAEAVDCFDQTRSHLRNAFGIDPSPTLQGLHRKILQQDEQLDWVPPGEARHGLVAAGSTAGRDASVLVVPRQLPAGTTAFTGRDSQIEAIVAAAEAGRPVVAVDGPAGVGKTALAVHTGHVLASRFPDGQLFFDLHGWDRAPTVSVGEALDRALRALGFTTEYTPPHMEEKAAVFRELLTGRRVLVIVDNALDVLQVRALLPAESGCFVISTSRRRLIGLLDAEPMTLDGLAPDHSVDLFARITGIDDPVRVAEVVDACDHLPLAIRIAAARLRSRPHWTIDDLIVRLPEGRRLRLLDRGSNGISTALKASLDALPTRLRRSLPSLAALTDIDVESFAHAACLPPPDAEDLLEELCDEHLLKELPQGRYQLSGLTREYITDQLDAP